MDARAAEAATRLLSDPALRKERGDAGRRIVAENRGALERLMGLLEPLLADQKLDEARYSKSGARAQLAAINGDRVLYATADGWAVAPVDG